MTPTDRALAPVFVVGSPRSGTTLLYDMLLSSGHFAVYLTESNVFSVLAQRFGDLSLVANRRKLLRVWLASKLYRASGLQAQLIEKRILEDCSSYGDFLRITMEEIARSQNLPRWAENTPEHILYLPVIKAAIPNALVVHMIRDGRAVALSLDRRPDRGIQGLPWDRQRNLMVQALYWEWIVRRGRGNLEQLGHDYIEIKFEDLVGNPREVLSRLGDFISCELDYDRIQKIGYGSVAKPNTSFKQESQDACFDPVSRWRKAYSPEELATVEGLVGDYLKELGYPLLTSPAPSASLRTMRARYETYFSARFKIKTSSIFKKLRPALTAQVLDEIVMGAEGPPVLKA